LAEALRGCKQDTEDLLEVNKNWANDPILKIAYDKIVENYAKAERALAVTKGEKP
jgi:hypothetical protein